MAFLSFRSGLVLTRRFSSTIQGRKQVGSRVFVSGLAEGTQSQDLVEYFKAHGTVRKAEIGWDNNKHCARDFGYVTFQSEQEVLKLLGAANIRRVVIKGKEVTCQLKRREWKCQNSECKSVNSADRNTCNGCQTPRPKALPLPGSGGAGLCYEFRDTGKCKFGDRCRFSHEAVAAPDHLSSEKDVVTWLRSKKMYKVARIFAKHKVNGFALAVMKKEKLREMGLTTDDQRILMVLVTATKRNLLQVRAKQQKQMERQTSLTSALRHSTPAVVKERNKESLVDGIGATPDIRRAFIELEKRQTAESSKTIFELQKVVAEQAATIAALKQELEAVATSNDSSTHSFKFDESDKELYQHAKIIDPAPVPSFIPSPAPSSAPGTTSQHQPSPTSTSESTVSSVCVPGAPSTSTTNLGQNVGTDTTPPSPATATTIQTVPASEITATAAQTSAPPSSASTSENPEKQLLLETVEEPLPADPIGGELSGPMSQEVWVCIHCAAFNNQSASACLQCHKPLSDRYLTHEQFDWICGCCEDQVHSAMSTCDSCGFDRPATWQAVIPEVARLGSKATCSTCHRISYGRDNCSFCGASFSLRTGVEQS